MSDVVIVGCCNVIADEARDEIDALAEQRLLRGVHIVPALDAYERGDSVPDVMTVPASPLSE